MKASYIVPVLNSHEIIRRQYLWLKRLNIPDCVEIIFVDDGSDPPIEAGDGLKNFTMLRTHDTRPWTWPLARNMGAKYAQGEFLIMLDVDHVLTQEALDAVLDFNGDCILFTRELAILDENGFIRQDSDSLRTYGTMKYLIRRPTRTIVRAFNNLTIRRKIFFNLGAYREDRITIPVMMDRGEDRIFRKCYKAAVRNGTVKPIVDGPIVYMIPNGRYCGDIDYNPMGLFHGLSRL